MQQQVAMFYNHYTDMWLYLNDTAAAVSKMRSVYNRMSRRPYIEPPFGPFDLRLRGFGKTESALAQLEQHFDGMLEAEKADDPRRKKSRSIREYAL